MAALHFKLRLLETELPTLASRYRIDQLEMELLERAPAIRDQGWLSRQDLRELADWKSPRRARDTERNSDQFVKEITSFALGTSDERARVQALTLLDGVAWPTSSAILHLFHRDPYPILDWRALWSLGEHPPSAYSFTFWWSYLKFLFARHRS